LKRDGSNGARSSDGPRSTISSLISFPVAADIVTGRLAREVVEAAGRLLGLGDREAAAHHEVLLDRRHGLIADGQVDEASINTLIDLRRRHSPSPDLDTVASAWPAMFTEAALGAHHRA